MIFLIQHFAQENFFRVFYIHLVQLNIQWLNLTRLLRFDPDGPVLALLKFHLLWLAKIIAMLLRDRSSTAHQL